MEHVNFTKYSASEDFEKKYYSLAQGIDYFDRLLQFSRKQSFLKGRMLTGNEPELPRIIEDLKIVVNAVTDESQQSLGQYFIEELETEPQFAKIGNLYHYLIKNWDVAKNLIVTYKLAAELANLDDWWDYQETWEEYLNLGKPEEN